MKKLCYLLIFILVLSACQKTETIKVIVPFGSTQMSQHLLEKDTLSYQVDVIQGADPLIAAFGSRSHDVIFAPLTLGAKMYETKPDYELLATVIWGNFYFVTNRQDILSFEDLEGKSVVLFGRNQTADIIINYLFSELNLNVSINYVDSLSSATAEFSIDPQKIVLVAEPNYSMLKLTHSNLKSLSIQQAYFEITGIERIPQAGVFVKRALSQSLKIKIAQDLKASINTLYENPEQSLAYMIEQNPVFNLSAAILSLCDQHIMFIEGKDSKDAITFYFSLILANQPSQIGGILPADDFYLKVLP